MKIIWIAFLLNTLIFPSLCAQVMIGQTEVDTTTVIEGLDVPWELLYGPDDHLWVTERFGQVSRVDPVSGDRTVILDLSGSIYVNGEAGLLGMTLHPDFDSDPFVFLAYTYLSGEDILKRVVRYTFSGDELLEPAILLDSVPAKNNHNGCRLLIAPDGKLLITNGDAIDYNNAQNMDYLTGKILRINLDGSIPGDNPWAGSPIYTLGHRNPQGLCLGTNGLIYSSEHGPASDDELNVIEAGRNYGWFDVWGFCDEPDEVDFCEAFNVKEPAEAWTPTVATSDIIHYNHPAIPEWEGRILMTTLKNKRLYALELDENGQQVVDEDQYFDDFWGRLRDVCQGPDGSVYLATNGPDWNNSQPFTHRIVRVWNPDYSVSVTDSGDEDRIVTLYPNPVRDQLHFTFEQGAIGHRLQVISSTGVVAVSRNISSNSLSLDAGKLAGGLYLVTVGEPGNWLFRGKVMVLED